VRAGENLESVAHFVGEEIIMVLIRREKDHSFRELRQQIFPLLTENSSLTYPPS